MNPGASPGPLFRGKPRGIYQGRLNPAGVFPPEKEKISERKKLFIPVLGI